MKRITFTLLLLLTAFIASGQVKYDTIPLIKDGEVTKIKLSVNGSRPLTFLVDTGAESNILDSRILELLGLRHFKENFNGDFIGVGGRSNTYAIEPAEVSYSGRTIKTKFRGMYLGDIQKLINVNGIIGMSFLKDCIIDFNNKQIYKPWK